MWRLAGSWDKTAGLQRRAHIKTAYHHGRLREDLVTAALEIIGKEGAEALTLEAVGKRLGVSRTAPYRHFASKGALLAAVAADGFAALFAQTQAAIEAAGRSPVARFRAIGEAYLRFAVARPAHFRVMYGPRAPELQTGRAAEIGRASFGLVRDVVVACQEAGQAAAGDPRLVVVEAWSYAHGLAALYLDGMLPRWLTPAALIAMGGNIEVLLRRPGGQRRPRGQRTVRVGRRR
jgi:AcrR family transcriptional regulator